MIKIKINRWRQDDCLLGRLRLGEFQCFTLEPPFLDNQRNISAIPEGCYTGFYRVSPTNGPCIELMDVPGRSHIQIHKGNYARNTKGCILVGSAITFLDGDKTPDVTNSLNTLNKLLSLIDKDKKLQILIEG